MYQNNVWKAELWKTEDLTFNTNIGQPSPSDDSPLIAASRAGRAGAWGVSLSNSVS